MIKLTEKEILDIDSSKEYYIKLGKFNPYGISDIPCWEGLAKLYTQRRKDGSLCLICPNIEMSWAEYCEKDIQSNGTLMSEEYSMQIYFPESETNNEM